MNTFISGCINLVKWSAPNFCKNSKDKFISWITIKKWHLFIPKFGSASKFPKNISVYTTFIFSSTLVRIILLRRRANSSGTQPHARVIHTIVLAFIERWGRKEVVHWKSTLVVIRIWDNLLSPHLLPSTNLIFYYTRHRQRTSVTDNQSCVII